jgi:hypothetical protein
MYFMKKMAAQLAEQVILEATVNGGQCPPYG